MSYREEATKLAIKELGKHGWGDACSEAFMKIVLPVIEPLIKKGTADRIFKGVEARIRGSYYISPDNKLKVIQGLQVLKKKEGL